MSKNYKIVINPTPPDPDQINRYKDFDALMDRYDSSRRKKGKLRIMYMAGAVAASILLIGSFLWLNRSPLDVRYEKAAQAYFASQPFVNPPMEDIQIPASQAAVAAVAGDTLTFNSGSRLIIPPRAFVDQDGRPVEGAVDIQFKEMHDFVDFFISGIPMHYDSNGIKYQLESAGMIELLGFKDGRRVQLAPGKEMAIELVSRVQMPRINTAPPKYNIYRLDTEDRQWVYAGLDRIQLIAEENPSDQTFFDQLKSNFQAVINQIEQNHRQNINALEAAYSLPEKPVEPTERRKDTPTIELDFLDDFQEVEFYEDAQEKLEKIRQSFDGVIWQLAPNSSPVAPAQFEKIWQSASIQAVNEQEFEITLRSENENLTLRVVPVLGTSGYQQALDKYRQQMEAYDRALQQRAQALKNRVDSLNRAKEALIAKEQQQFESTVEKMVKEGRIDPDQTGTFKVINRFTVGQFGIWNCDRPIAPGDKTVPIKLIDQNGKKITGKTAFVASKKHNTVFQYLATNNTPISFMDDSELLIWVVSEDNKLAMLKTLGPAQSSGKEEMRLEVTSEEINDEEDLREVLFF